MNELKRANATEKFNWDKTFKYLIYAATIGSGAATLWSFDEYDERGREHVFTGFVRWKNKKVDEFFGVDEIIKSEQEEGKN